MLVSPDMAAMSAVMPVVAMMGVVRFSAAFATELAVRAASNMMFAFGAFLGFVQYVSIAEFITVGRAAMRQLVLAMDFIVVLVMLHAFIMNLATVSLVVLTVMLFVLLVHFMAMCHYFVSISLCFLLLSCHE
jgi:hypothetical protein